MKRVRPKGSAPRQGKAKADESISKNDKPKKGDAVKLFLDSGAFGAWSRGQVIPVREYIKYIQENEEFLWQYVSLDVIPGEFGHRSNSQKEIEVSAKGSYANHQTMKEAGLRPIPVFHQGETMRGLEQYLKDGENYIGLSANKFVRVSEQKRWLDSVFNVLTDAQGRPLVRTHGFALTTFPLLTSYPWYTVDSTTWSLTPGYGQIIIPAFIRGKFEYLHTPTRVAISGVTHKSVSSQKKQIEFMGAFGNAHVGVVKKFLEEVVGVTITQARYATNDRRRAMLVYYLELCKHIRDVHYTGPRARVFGNSHFDTGKMKALEPFNLILTFATSLNREWSELLTDVGANYRLLSYWEMRKRDNSVLHQYVQTGTHGKYQRAPTRATWDETYRNRRRIALFKRLDDYEKNEGKN